MSDILTTWGGVQGDYRLDGASLASGGDLYTAVLNSIFTDATAAPDDLISDGTTNPRGWWGDDPTAPIGSKLWLLQRSKRTQQTLARAQDYATGALQWLITDGVASRVEVFAEWVDSSQLSMLVTIYRADGTTASLRFARLWADIQDTSNL